MPPGFRKAAYNQEDSDGEEGECLPGPALPPGYCAESSNSDDEEVIGPMPAKGPVQNTVVLDIERRAKRMKEKLTGVVRHLPFSVYYVT